mmetsp:Transcript_108823/g.209097  ORF Transcript_108823/g.209097 Transcript_108823/m.209097 type:complete len:229 (-) Transcript_108823:174-860(-)
MAPGLQQCSVPWSLLAGQTLPYQKRSIALQKGFLMACMHQPQQCHCMCTHMESEICWSLRVIFLQGLQEVSDIATEGHAEHSQMQRLGTAFPGGHIQIPLRTLDASPQFSYSCLCELIFRHANRHRRRAAAREPQRVLEEQCSDRLHRTCGDVELHISSASLQKPRNCRSSRRRRRRRALQGDTCCWRMLSPASGVPVSVTTAICSGTVANYSPEMMLRAAARKRSVV